MQFYQIKVINIYFFKKKNLSHLWLIIIKIKSYIKMKDNKKKFKYKLNENKAKNILKKWVKIIW